MDKVVIVSAVYPPEPFVSARMAQDLAKHLAAIGYKTSVLCPQPSRPVNADYRQYIKADTPVLKQEGGIEIARLPSFSFPKSSLLLRLYESWSFGRHVCRYLGTYVQQQPDVLYVNAWPLLAQAQIVRYAYRQHIPTVLQIMDIYPESLINKLPAVLRGIVRAPLTLMDTWIVRKAHSVVLLSDNMKRIYIQTRRISDNHLVVITTWQDETLFGGTYDRSEACRSYDINDKLFTFLYLGNIGPVSGVEFLIEAFHKAALNSAQLLIVGAGSSRDGCMALAKMLAADNIHFISDPNAENVPLLQSMADVCLLPMKKNTGMSSIPSKLSAYMFSAKPVLATVDDNSDTAQTMRQARCGWVGAPENIDWLTTKMREVRSLSMNVLVQQGESGRQYALANFSKAVGVRRLADVIIAAIR